MDNQLAKHGIIEGNHNGILHECGIEMHSAAAGNMQKLHSACRTCIDTTFDGVSLQADILLLHIQGHLTGNTNLPFHNIHAADFLRNGMLHLQTGIHFDEIKLPIGCKQKFYCACIGIICRLCRQNCRIHHFSADILCHNGAGRFLQYLLLIQLERAVSFAQTEDVPLLVCQNLHFHMAHMGKVFL